MTAPSKKSSRKAATAIAGKSGKARPEKVKKVKKAEEAGEAENPEEIFLLRLYVAGQTPKSLTALANLKKICEEHLGNKYHLEVIDLLQDPQLAQGDQILAIPTLVRKLPPPLKRIISDLSNTEKVIVGLDLRPR